MDPENCTIWGKKATYIKCAFTTSDGSSVWRCLWSVPDVALNDVPVAKGIHAIVNEFDAPDVLNFSIFLPCTRA